jgi:maleylacetoacetate isomerase
MLQLYTYFRSSATYRVRIALALKGVPYTSIPVHLRKDGGMQHSSVFAALNPAQLVPVLVDGDALLTQSLAIIEYLEETHPQPALLPSDALGRARVRSIAQAIACDAHPLCNLRVLQYLQNNLGVTDAQKDAWYAHWMALGLEALEKDLAHHASTGIYCHGNTPTLADCCLVPHYTNAQRFYIPLDHYPTLTRIVHSCQQLEVFQQAAPHRQADAE